MDSHGPRDLLRYFEPLQDPRPRHNTVHLFSDILVIAILAVTCGAQGWTDCQRFGQAKARWLKTFLKLPGGIPSHDTFGRVIGALDPEQFEQCFLTWTRALAQATAGRIVGLDGKTLRRSFDRTSRKAAIHMVSAWCDDNRLVLGQLATDAKSNEISTLPKLLKMLDLRGATVTADAMHCQKQTAGQIVQARAQYVLQVKANHKTLHEEMKLFFDEAFAHRFEGMAYARHQEVDKGHGRIETRTCYSTWDIGWFADRKQWKGLGSFVCVESQRDVDGKISRERRYYLSSHDGRDAAHLLKATRQHWGVENPLHWCLDVTYGEDHCRIRKDHGAENFSRLRRMTMNLLRQDKSRNESLRGKIKLCAWDQDYLLQVISQRPQA